MANSTLTPSGRRPRSAGPSVATGACAGSSTQRTAWGLSMVTGWISAPRTSVALPSVETAPSRARTVPSGRTATGRSPTAVSTTNSGVGHHPPHPGEPGDAPQPVAAHLGGGTVGVPVAHPDPAVSPGGHLEDSVGADAVAPVAPGLHLLGGDLAGPFDDHEVVAQPVHLHEVHAGSRRAAPGPVRPGRRCRRATVPTGCGGHGGRRSAAAGPAPPWPGGRRPGRPPRAPSRRPRRAVVGSRPPGGPSSPAGDGGDGPRRAARHRPWPARRRSTRLASESPGSSPTATNGRAGR